MHEKWTGKILLAKSGELSQPDLADLQTHLDECQVCRQYRDDLDRITAESRDSLPAGEPSPSVMAAIRAAAAQRVQTGRAILPFPRSATQLLAYAAAFLMLAAGWYAFVSHGHSDRIQELRAILAMTGEGNGGGVATPQKMQNKEEHLRNLGKELLRMEGLLVPDDVSNSEI